MTITIPDLASVPAGYYVGASFAIWYVVIALLFRYAEWSKEFMEYRSETPLAVMAYMFSPVVIPLWLLSKFLVKRD